MNKYRIAANVDIGCERENQEDFAQFKELDDDTLFCVIADGTGSREGHPHPASIASMEIIMAIEEYYDTMHDLLFEDPCGFIKAAMVRANRVLGAFKMGNEELFSGYAASITCCLLTADERMFIGHSGNTRLYLLRNGKIRQVTQDHTKGMELYNDNKIDLETYYVHPDRLVLTSCIGMIAEPKIDTYKGSFKDRDLMLMTTDGIHYAIKEDALQQIILEAQSTENATAALVDAAKNIIKYPDNMSAVLVCKTASLNRR